jgi:hypothetical protein
MPDDRPTDDRLAEAADALRRTYPVPVKGKEYADRVDRAAARILELEALLAKIVVEGDVVVRQTGPLLPGDDWFMGLAHSTVDLTDAEAEFLTGLMASGDVRGDG